MKLLSQEEIKKALELLENPNLALKQLALEQLKPYKNEPEALNAVIRTLQDKNDEVRSLAAEILGEVESREALIALSKAIEDSSWKVRKSALEAFGKHKNPETTPFFIAALRDENAQVRYTAAKELKNFNSHSMIEPLFDALRDKEKAVREEAKITLLNFPLQVPPSLVARFLLDYDKNIREVVVQFLSSKMEGNPIPHLEKACKDQEWEIRVLALQEIGKFIEKVNKDDYRLLNLNLASLEDDNARVRYQAIENLKKLNNPQALEPLGKIAREDDDSNNRLMGTETMTFIRRSNRIKEV